MQKKAEQQQAGRALLLHPLWRRMTRACLAITPALIMSLAPMAQAEARPANLPVQPAGGASTQLPIVEAQYYPGPPPGYWGPPRRHGPPPRWRPRPPPGYWGPPRHHRPPPRWRHRPPPGYWGPPPPPPGYYRYSGDPGPGAAVAAGVAGLAAGAILGSALTAQNAPPPPGNSWLSYCADKYNSFDPETGTYLGYDGLRHPCQ